jgi:hypothetical protein
MKSFDVAFGTNLIGEMKMTWSPEVPGIGGGTSDGPSLAVFNGRLFAAWKGVPNDTRMFYSSFDGHAWSPEAQGIGGNTSDTPSLAVFNNRLFAAWKGVPNDTRMFCSSFDGQRWLPEQPGVGGGTSNGPSLAVFNNRLFAGWKGVPNDNRMFYSKPGPDWNSFNVEQQASIVDQWFGGQTSATHQQMDTHNPYYRYVWSSILGSPSPVPA